MSNYIGQVKENQHGQKYKVLERKEGSYYFLVEFVETGYRTTVHGTTLTSKDRRIKDCLSPSICGVGMLGYAAPKNHKKEYGLWTEMLKRCYDKFYEKYRYFGAAGVRFSDRWLRFDYFLEDLPKVKGYDEVLWKESRIRLVQNNGFFSLEDARFVSNRETMKRRRGKRLRPFLGCNGEQTYYGLNGLTDFAEEHGLSFSCISRCLSGKADSYRGWTFRYLRSDEYEKLCKNA